MTRDLHRDPGHLPFAHDRKQRLQVGRLGCRVLTWQYVVSDACLDGADQAGAMSGRTQAGLDEVRRGRLAVRARDTDQQEVRRRVVVPEARDRSEHVPWATATMTGRPVASAASRAAGSVSTATAPCAAARS